MSDIMDLLEENKLFVDPVLYRYYKCLEKRQILISQDILEDFLEKAVIPYIEMDKDGSGEEITILISTAGGSLFHGMALVDALEKCVTPTTIVGIGMCMSMGLNILCAGKENPNVKRVCYPSTVGLLHSGSMGVQGDTNQAKDYMEFLEKYDKEITEQHIVRNTNITIRKFRSKKRVEQYMTSKELLSLGFVDEIL